MRFAIRDDDTCYFTQPDELERIYSRLAGFGVSLAVTPFAIRSDYQGDPVRFHQSGPPMALSENAALSSYLRTEVARGRYSILCHGHTHEYLRRGSQLIQEGVWKSASRLREETALGRLHLEGTLGCPVEAYVPPGNSISRAGIAAVGATFPKILTTLPLLRLREFVADTGSLTAWTRRLADQIRYGGPSPFAYSLGRVRLLACTSWTAVADWKLTLRRLELARRLGADFTVAVHYWELQGAVLDGLIRLAERAVGLGFQPAHCADLFEAGEGAGESGPASRKGTQWADSKIS